MKSPLVSVVIPCYNGDKYLSRAIDSALAQTYKNIEIIVVDDGSTRDSVGNICKTYGNAIRYIYQANSGLSGARNTGIKASKGYLIAFLDDDDLWFPNKILDQVQLFQSINSENVGLINTGIQYVDESENKLHRQLISFSKETVDKLIYFDFVGLPSSVIVPKKIFDIVGFFDTNLKSREDYDMWLRIAERFELYSCDKFLTLYTLRRSSMSKNAQVMIENTEVVTSKLVERNKFNFKTEKKIAKYRSADYARRLRENGYEALRHRGDGGQYRRELRKASVYDWRQISFRDLLLYIVSPFAAKKISRYLTSKEIQRKDFIKNLDDIVF